MENRFDILVSDLCYEIDYLREELERVTQDRDHWRKEYNKYLDLSIKHSNVMMGHLVNSLLNKTEANK